VAEIHEIKIYNKCHADFPYTAIVVTPKTKAKQCNKIVRKYV